MKKKTAKQPKPSKRTANLKDIKPRKNPKGGGGRYTVTALAAQITAPG